MNQDLIIKIVCFVLACAFLIAVRAWAQSETVIAWCHREYYREPRMANRFPKPTKLRRMLLLIFKLKIPGQ